MHSCGLALTPRTVFGWNYVIDEVELCFGLVMDMVSVYCGLWLRMPNGMSRKGLKKSPIPSRIDFNCVRSGA